MAFLYLAQKPHGTSVSTVKYLLPERLPSHRLCALNSLGFALLLQPCGRCGQMPCLSRRYVNVEWSWVGLAVLIAVQQCLFPALQRFLLILRSLSPTQVVPKICLYVHTTVVQISGHAYEGQLNL